METRISNSTEAQSHRNTLIQRIILALALGYIFFFFGERVFWSFPHPGDTLISNFFGWLTEGVIAMTLFGGGGLPFPIGISWTGLAWHAFISVFIGWYLVMMFLNGNHYKKIIFFSIGLGIFWGVWSLAWALETPPIAITPDIYLLHGLITVLLLSISHHFFSKYRPGGFTTSRWEKTGLAVPVLAFFIFVTIPAVGLFAAVLPVLFGILYFALKKNRDREESSG